MNVAKLGSCLPFPGGIIAMILIVSLSCSLAANPEDPLAEGDSDNNELEYCTNRVENANAEGGSLVITARKEAYAGSAYAPVR